MSVVGAMLQSMEYAPPEIARNYALMRELDRLVAAVLARVAPVEAEAAALRNSGRDAEATTLLTRMAGELHDCRMLSDEKLSLARRTFELLDSLVARVDERLHDLPGSAANQATQQQQPPLTASAVATPAPPVPDEDDETEDNEELQQDEEEQEHQQGEEEEEDSGRGSRGVRVIDEAAPIEPGEKLYCLCQRVSFGEMIECENPGCRYEWFHIECVGLSAKPPEKKKWFCPECRALLKKKH